MNKNFVNSLDIIKKILDTTSNINSYVEKKSFDESEKLLTEKDQLLSDFNSIDKTSFNKDEKSKINDYIYKIKKIEDSYIKKMNEFLKESKQENKDIKINKKLSKAYKISVENKPKIVDSKE